MNNETIKAKDCFFTAEVEITDRSSDDIKSTPVRMVARSGDSIEHHYFGTVVHDLDGMEHKSRVPIDFNHNENEIVGYLNRFETDSGDLETRGALTPYGDNDRATEIIHKAELGVPWEASINFAGPMVIERIEEGTVNVNGREFSAPLTVVRKWMLRGVAITPYGYDHQTSTSLSDADREFSVTVLEKESEMADQNLITEVPEETTLSAETDQAVVDVPKVNDTTEAETELQTDDSGSAVEVDEGRAVLGGRFMEAFGTEHGARYFAEGLSWEDAMASHLKSQAEQIETLKAKLSAAQSGEAEPVSWLPTEQSKPKESVFKLKD